MADANSFAWPQDGKAPQGASLRPPPRPSGVARPARSVGLGLDKVAGSILFSDAELRVLFATLKRPEVTSDKL